MWKDLILILVVTCVMPVSITLIMWWFVFRPINKEQKADWEYYKNLKDLRSKRGK